MNTFLINSCLVVVNNVIMAIFLLSKGRQKAINRIFSAMSVAIAIWGLGGLMVSFTPKAQYDLAMFWWQVAYIGIIFIPVFYTHFIFTFLNLRKRFFIVSIYVIALIFLFFDWYDHSSLFLVELKFMFGQFYWNDLTRVRSPIYILFYIAFYWVLLTYAFLFLLRYYIKTKDLARNQCNYIILGSMIGWLGGHSNFLPSFGINIYPNINFLTAFYAPILAYGIVRYRVMDIRVAITRAGIFILVYTFILGLPLWFGVKTGLWFWSVLLMAILGSAGPFIYSNLREQIENVIFKERQRLQEHLRSAGKRIAQITKLPTLWETLIQEAHKAVNPKFVQLYILSKEDKTFALNQNSILNEASHNIEQISVDSLLVKSLIRHKITMFIENSFCLNLPLETIAVPFFAEGELFGFLLLGPKPKKSFYNEADFVTFDIFSSQASLAIENAKHLQELKYSQLELLRQENLKFVQVLVKGLAHEILNPLTPLMHRIEDLEGESLLKLYELYENSGAKFDKEEKEKFKEAVLGLRDSTKSLKNNAEHIRLIVDTLNKMQKGDETTIGPLDLKSFFKDVIPLLSLEVEPHLQESVTINQDIAKDIPPIKGNPTLLKQIFINLYKNSCEAMKNSIVKTINISSKLNPQNSKEALLEFSDTGPGIPSAIVSKIFTHGFTTKGAKGSGIGLSQCKAIIEKFGGTINIETEQNQGVRFIIKLPVW